MTTQVRIATASIFSAITIPDDRVKANQCYSKLRDINTVANSGKSLIQEQLEWLIDEIKDKTNIMYPDRYMDHSTPALRAELNQLQKDKQQVLTLMELLDSLAHETEVRLPSKVNPLPIDHSFFEAELEGM